MSDHTVTLSTPITDQAERAHAARPSGPVVQSEVARELERDCMTMALRLYAEHADLFSPECHEVMSRWRPRVEALLNEKENEL